MSDNQVAPSDITMSKLTIAWRTLQLYTLSNSSNAACLSVILFVHEFFLNDLHSQTKNVRGFAHMHSVNNNPFGQYVSKYRSS